MSGLLPALGSGGGGGGSGALSGLLSTHAAVQMAAGGLSGLVAMSAAIAAGVVPVGAGSSGPPALPLVICPGSADVVAIANTGDKMLITARSADGSWLRVYIPGPAAHNGWVRTDRVDLLADGSKLPVAGCGGVGGATGAPSPGAGDGLALVSPTIAATASAGTAASPSSKPTVAPTATPKTPPPTTGATAAPPATLAPTPKPNVGPVFTSGPTHSVNTILADPTDEGDCWGLPHRVLTKVVVTDPDGVTGVELWAKKPGETAFSKLAHGFFHYTSYWGSSIDSYMDHIYAGGTLSFYAVAVDGTGLKTKSKTASVAVRPCDRDAAVTVTIDLPVTNDGAYLVNGCSWGPVPWYVSVRDPDGRVTTAVLSLTKTNYLGTVNETVTLRHLLSPSWWYGESTTRDLDTKTSWVLTATDVNGGTTISPGSAIIRRACIK